MSARIRRNLPLLQVFQKASPKQRKKILAAAKPDFIISICEIADNILCGNLKLSKKQKGKLNRHKKALRGLVVKKISTKRKKAFLTQRGGFLPLIVAPLLGIAGSLLGDVISKAVSK